MCVGFNSIIVSGSKLNVSILSMSLSFSDSGYVSTVVTPTRLSVPINSLTISVLLGMSDTIRISLSVFWLQALKISTAIIKTKRFINSPSQ